MYSNRTGRKSVLKDRRTERLKLELEKKDAKIEQLKNKTTQWEVACKEVKGRNAWLLKMMQEGEGIRLCAALEQERYKVKQLQAELTEDQSGKKGKGHSERDQCRRTHLPPDSKQNIIKSFFGLLQKCDYQ